MIDAITGTSKRFKDTAASRASGGGALYCRSILTFPSN